MSFKSALQTSSHGHHCNTISINRDSNPTYSVTTTRAIAITEDTKVTFSVIFLEISGGVHETKTYVLPYIILHNHNATGHLVEEKKNSSLKWKDFSILHCNVGRLN